MAEEISNHAGVQLETNRAGGLQINTVVNHSASLDISPIEQTGTISPIDATSAEELDLPGYVNIHETQAPQTDANQGDAIAVDTNATDVEVARVSEDGGINDQQTISSRSSLHIGV
jgi:hypothetical protein